MTRFTFVSGNPGLDLAGTVQHRRTDRRDLLTGPAELARWLVEAGILDTEPHIDAAGLKSAVALREAAYRLALDTASAADRDLLNRAAAARPAQVALTPDGTIDRAGTLNAALSTLARATIELLGSPAAARVRECGADACTRLYIDSSRAASRRWCDMQECGNRAKAAGFRARHIPTP